MDDTVHGITNIEDDRATFTSTPMSPEDSTLTQGLPPQPHQRKALDTLAGSYVSSFGPCPLVPRVP